MLRERQVRARGHPCFVSGDAPHEVREKVGNGEKLITVFMPNAPNPTTGFVMFMPAKDVILLDMAIDDAAKLVFDWEGGTRIGDSIDAFVRGWGRRGLSRGAIYTRTGRLIASVAQEGLIRKRASD